MRFYHGRLWVSRKTQGKPTRGDFGRLEGI
nr:MAG TPA: hypothetical protein [Caudoviricetes sp.]